MKTWTKDEQPHSQAEHNPFWCGGNLNGDGESDDPCWSCMQWLHSYALDWYPYELIRGAKANIK